jgi:myosin heavy subunit
LQCAFNQQLFQNDLQIFQEEQIEINLTLEDCPSNLHCVHLIASPSSSTTSIMSLLQSVGQSPKGTDESFCENLHRHFEAMKDSVDLKRYFITVHPKDRKKIFSIKHYAGRVNYTVAGNNSSTESKGDASTWISKNHDHIPLGLLNILLSSPLELIQQISGCREPPTANIARSGKLVLSASTNKKLTVSDRFLSSMNDLFASLKSSSCSFIKCIKPNRLLQPMLFDEPYVIEQVRSLGLVQVCEVMKVGLPIRIPYSEIRSQFPALYSETRPLFCQREGREESSDEEEQRNLLRFVAVLMFALKVPIESYRLGKRRIFFTANSYEFVDKLMATDETIAEIRQTLLNGLQEGIKIWNASSDLVATFSSTLLELDETIHQIKSQVDDFDVQMNNATKALEALNHQVTVTKTSANSIAHCLPLEEKLIQMSQLHLIDLLNLSTANETQLLQKIFSETFEKYEQNEHWWESVGEKFLLVDESDLNDRSSEMQSMSSQLLSVSSEIDEIMPHVRHLINKTLTRAQAAPILKVESWAQDCEHNISLIKTQLERMVKLLSAGGDLVRQIDNSITEMQGIVSDISAISERIQETDAEIQQSCRMIDSRIEEVKADIARHEMDQKRKEAELRQQKEEFLRQEEALRLEAERQKKENEEKIRLQEEEEEERVALELLRVNEQEPEPSDDHTDDKFIFGEEEDLPPGWERIQNPETKDGSGGVDWVYRSLLTNEYQTDPPLYPAKTKTLDDDDEYDEIKTEEIFEDQDEALNPSQKGADRQEEIVQPKVKRLSFVSFATTEGAETDQLQDFVTSSKALTSASTAKSLLNRMFSIVQEEYVTASNSQTVVSVHKKGILFKQGKFFGVWKRVFLLLDGNRLEQYKSSQAYYSGSPATKQIQLTSRSVLSYTKYSNCLTIYDGEATRPWVLMTENEKEFQEWMDGLNAVITALFHERIEIIRLSKYR